MPDQHLPSEERSQGVFQLPTSQKSPHERIDKLAQRIEPLESKLADLGDAIRNLRDQMAILPAEHCRDHDRLKAHIDQRFDDLRREADALLQSVEGLERRGMARS